MMKNRKRNRKKGFDYTSNNIYFITICCKYRIHHLGKIANNQMELNVFGEIVEEQITWLKNQYEYVEMHNSVVMPNHVHLLFEINPQKNPSTKTKSVSELMGAFKTISSKQIHLYGNMDFEWQRSFHDHIVVDADRYDYIYNYITNNPVNWFTDVLKESDNSIL
jgi:putative transposase